MIDQFADVAESLPWARWQRKLAIRQRMSELCFRYRDVQEAPVTDQTRESPGGCICSLPAKDDSSWQLHLRHVPCLPRDSHSRNADHGDQQRRDLVNACRLIACPPN